MRRAASSVSRDGHRPVFDRVGLLLLPARLPEPVNPALVMEAEQRGRVPRTAPPIANEQWRTVQEQDRQNVELLKLSQEILELTREVHDRARAES